MEKIEKMRGFESRFQRFLDRKKLPKYGLSSDDFAIEEKLSARFKEKVASLPDGRVPDWVVRFLSNPEVKPRSAEEIRKMLSKIKGSISDTIVEDRYGGESS